MEFQPPLRAAEAANFEFFLALPDIDPALLKLDTLRGSQLVRPIFEFSGACAGCGETPYLKLFSQLFGDRAMIANATGCTSIYGGNLPTTPWAKRADGRGPAWSNSLFEDNAEFGFGMRLAVDKFTETACELLDRVAVLFVLVVQADTASDEGDQGGRPVRPGRDRGPASAGRYAEEGAGRLHGKGCGSTAAAGRLPGEEIGLVHRR